MIGNNVMIFNQDSMCEALQQWFDKTWSNGGESPPTVINIEEDNHSTGTFKVLLKSPEKVKLQAPLPPGKTPEGEVH